MKRKKPLSYEEIALFSRELAMIVNSDISLQEGLDLLIDQSDNKRVSILCLSLKNHINDGLTLTKSIEMEKEILTPYYVNMISIGENSGNLDIMLLRIADTYEKDSIINRKIQSAITYPLILTVLMFSVIVLLVVKVIPLFNDILISLGGELTGISKAIINTGGFIGEYILLISLIVIGLYLIYRFAKLINKFQSFFDKLKLILPFRKGIEKTYYAIVIAQNLSMLIRSGISIALAFDMIVPIIHNTVIKKKVKKASTIIKNENEITEAFNEFDMFPNIFKRLFQIALKTGHLDEVLQQAALKMEEQLDQRLDKLTTVLEPALIIVISLIVGVILLSIIFPVIEIMNTIG
ncbi:MAG: type II secretion system F family protein [Clostridiales bacterium]|nr:type II secretion system F family protein [Clostridiales bacterium]